MSMENYLTFDGYFDKSRHTGLGTVSRKCRQNTVILPVEERVEAILTGVGEEFCSEK